MNAGFDKGELSITQKQGILMLIPKKDKLLEYLKNWRPLSIYVFKAIKAQQHPLLIVKTKLDKLIHIDQNGFLTGIYIYIATNVRLVFDIMKHAEENNIPELLLIITSTREVAFRPSPRNVFDFLHSGQLTDKIYQRGSYIK